MKIINNLEILAEFLKGALERPDDSTKKLVDTVYLVPNGQEGEERVQALFQEKIRPGDDVAFVQIGQNVIEQLDKSNTRIKVFINVVILKKYNEDALKAEDRLQARNILLMKMLKFIGYLNEANEFYWEKANGQTGGPLDPAEIEFLVDRNLIEPIGRIGDALSDGYYIDVDAIFNVNKEVYG